MITQLEWTLIPSGIPDVVLHRTRVPSNTNPGVSYKVLAVNGVVLSCTCPRFHFAENDFDICSHRTLAQECPPVFEEV